MSSIDYTTSDLIGYLTFDRRRQHVTLVLCGRGGRPLRALRLVPMGTVARLVRRMVQWLGIGGRAYRAIARGARDARSFKVWCTRDNGIVLSDALGENWLCSTSEPDDDSRTATTHGQSDVKYTRM